MNNFTPELLVLNVGLAHHNADWNWKNVLSPFARLYYVCSGEAAVQMPDGVHTLTPGHLYIIPPFTTHSYICTGLFTHYYIHIYEEHPYDREGLFDTYDLPFQIKAHPVDRCLFQRLTEINPTMLLAESNPDSYDDNQTLLHNIIKNKNRSNPLKLESRGIVYQLMSRFLQSATLKDAQYDDRITTATKYIRTHISDHLTIEQLAQTSCLSIDHFIRLFRSSTGCTPLQYINTRRIERAQVLLLSSNASVKHIAFSLGYDDPSYFIRVFKRVTGMTPKQFVKGQIDL